MDPETVISWRHVTEPEVTAREWSGIHQAGRAEKERRGNVRGIWKLLLHIFYIQPNIEFLLGS